MIRRPNTTDTVIQAGNRFLHPLEFLAACFLQQIRLLHDLLLLKISNADCFFTTVDVVAPNNGVSMRPWGDADFDLRVGFGESGKVVLEERSIRRAMCQFGRSY
jgi:hypothetical protein